MIVRIYKPAKTAMQSGLARTKEWVVEPETRKAVKKSYADNFKFGRIGSWTH